MSDVASCDYIVVGGGSAGCVVASRLSDNQDNRVVLLEAGGDTNTWKIKLPALSMLEAIGDPKYDWNLRYAADPTCNDREFVLNRGLGLGGSSAINGMVYLRGGANDFSPWRQRVGDQWTWETVSAAYQSIEASARSDEDRGTAGPQRTEIRKEIHPLTQAFLDACHDIGLERQDGLNVDQPDVYGLVEATQSGGIRASAARSFIYERPNKANLQIIKYARAQRIVFEDGRAVGVEYLLDGARRTVRAEKEVVLSAGAVMSPFLLMHSGIGPAAKLSEFGIDVTCDSPEVGQNLIDNAETMVTYEVAQRTVNQELSIIDKMRHGLKWTLTRDGRVAMPGADALALLKTGQDEAPGSDVLVYYGPYEAMMRDGEVVMGEGSGITFDPTPMHPKSRGFLKLQSPNPQDAPLIQTHLLEDERDVQVALRGMRWVDKLVQSPALSKHIKQRKAPVAAAASDEDMIAYMRAVARPSLHTSGTCRMGPDKTSVLDQYLRVRGVEGLRVADTSVLPEIGAVNTNAVAMMVGQRCADFIRQAA
ncbi:MAG: GMC family oxidoreductase N-terminal domain-containing protein [Pseudomonadota bacterium]